MKISALLFGGASNRGGKYSDTVADIKSKALKTILKTVVGSCKANFLAKDTSAFDPNMLLNEIETAHE
jgi:hypothetical protein